MTTLAIILAISAALFLLAAITAPLGYEDERGFHFGHPPEDEE